MLEQAVEGQGEQTRRHPEGQSGQAEQVVQNPEEKNVWKKLRESSLRIYALIFHESEWLTLK